MKPRSKAYFLRKKWIRGYPVLIPVVKLNLRAKRKAIKAYASGLTPMLGLWMDKDFIERKGKLYW